MNKSDLIEEVARVTCAKQEAKDAVNALFSVIKQALGKNDRVGISGFGTFSVRARKARMGRNPRTGQPIEISAKRVVKFKPANEILED
jgi:integration host factor subunit alpha